MNNYHIYGHNYDFQEFDEPILQEYSTKKNFITQNPITEKINNFLILFVDKFRNGSFLTKSITFIIILFGVYKYIQLKHKNPIDLFKIYLSNKGLFYIFIFTILFCLYVFIVLPDNNNHARFLKERTSDAIAAYIIAIFAFYDLPLPVFWVILFYDIFFIRSATIDL